MDCSPRIDAFPLNKFTPGSTHIVLQKWIFANYWAEQIFCKNHSCWNRSDFLHFNPEIMLLFTSLPVVPILILSYILIAKGGSYMFKTVVSVIIMVVASIAGMFLGALFNNAIGGMILLALISGLACIIHSLDNRNTWFRCWCSHTKSPTAFCLSAIFLAKIHHQPMRLLHFSYKKMWDFTSGLQGARKLHHPCLNKLSWQIHPRHL